MSKIRLYFRIHETNMSNIQKMLSFTHAYLLNHGITIVKTFIFRIYTSKTIE